MYSITTSQMDISFNDNSKITYNFRHLINTTNCWIITPNYNEKLLYIKFSYNNNEWSGYKDITIN